MNGLIKGMKWPPRISGMVPHDALWYAFVKKRADMVPLVLDDYHKFIMLKEWDFWEKNYLPPGGVEGMHVLDAGAGCGETAYFYFLKGAAVVTAIEPDPVAAECYRINSSALMWDTVLFERKFMLEDMNLMYYDFVKMDVEGGEEALLQLDRLPRGVYEVHGTALMWRFHEKFVKPYTGGFDPSAPAWKRVNRNTWLLKTFSFGA